MNDKYLVIVPTYNEKDNISDLIEAILEQSDKIDILVVDDNSPDQTAVLVEKLPRFNERIFLLKRKEKLGLGTAYLAGFGWSLEKNYDYSISMDADFSHPPTALCQMLNLSDKNKNNIILGSRYIPGGKIIGWKFNRYLNSYLANFVTRLMLGLPAHDATAGFKCYPRIFIQSLDFNSMLAHGYAFQVEMLCLAKQNNFSVTEFPITFHDRLVGESKISGELVKSAKIVWQLFLRQTWPKQFLKFCLVGLFCALIDIGVFYLAKLALHADSQSLKQISKAISFLVSASASYYLNRTWTFASQEKAILSQATKFLIVSSVGLALNNLFFFILTGILKLSDILGLILAIGIVMFWNFFGNKLWVFKNVVK